MESVKTSTDTALELAQFCAKCAEDKLAENTVVIPVRGVSSIADYFVVAGATSEPHLRALGSFVERQAREKFNARSQSESDQSESGWILLDFGDVLVHLMTAEMRERYNLEALWGECRETGNSK